MIFNIIIPYRPTINRKSSGVAPLKQHEDMSWSIDIEKSSDEQKEQIDCYTKKYNSNPFEKYREKMLENCIKSIRKNSVFLHKIFISAEHNVIFHDNYKQYMNEKFKEIYFFNSSEIVSCRATVICNTMRGAILSLPDDEFTVYAYASDLICGKYWDKHIVDAIGQHGDDKVYVAMWVEPRTNASAHANGSIFGEKDARCQMNGDTTPQNIWVEWRKLACHALSMKFPDKAYFEEKDLDNWSTICNSSNQENIVEGCGERTYCYYACMIAKNSIFRAASPYLSEPAIPDLLFDNNLNTDKVAVAKSHVFHMHHPTRLDDTEVEHEQ